MIGLELGRLLKINILSYEFNQELQVLRHSDKLFVAEMADLDTVDLTEESDDKRI
jgi:hypothetical protein